MARVALRVYSNPGSVEVLVNLRKADGSDHRLTAIVDTGGEVSLFPRHLLEVIEHQVIGQPFTITQAGIANQVFSAVEAMITGFVEDYSGARTKSIQFRAWFADTDFALLGFDGVLDRAKLFVDMADTQTGWIELRD